ncbi:sugar phosphate isomerase/epimerase family protein [Paenibacillus arenilitoris]|uniref:Sugar phosphate isomerase/epimerase n=1 Tax=Paenibacillus arenilitoris TaxID=2772299 RepID=A0A927CJE9_9BACL|nr:sugar phosphate isomerase/epimerase family protein [Paenibacillus arenilitoris]MBD2869189.1 sugar phosphate isomerase/epimerase [Paenibacillus arenilitoris]
MTFPFKLSLNASTLFPFKLGVEKQIAVAAEAGYDGIELWVRDIDAYLEAGGRLAELRRRLEDSGIAAVNAIAFWAWADSDEKARRQGFELAKRELEMLAELGCAAAAAPPFGSVSDVPLDDMAEQFAKLAELSRGIGVEPYLEFWGRAARLNRLSEAVYVAMHSGVKDAKLLLDPFHMYTGGSDFEGIGFLNGERIGIVHVNDYPAEPARADIADKDRVFPGDGIAPSGRIAQLLHGAGYNGYLSLELFIEDFGGRSALDIAKLGLGKARAAYSVQTVG